MSGQAMGSGATPHIGEDADTQSGMPASIPPMSAAWLLAVGPDASPRNGGDGDRRVERRRKGRSGNSPTDILRRLPAVVVLERIPVPALAMARNGVIVFANTAFAEMVGYRRNVLTGLAFQEIFHTVPAAVCAPSNVHALPNLVVELRHCAGWTVRAKMSKSALRRSDDPVALVTFEDLTERLWTTNDRSAASARTARG